jgi:hypothetical protein
MNNELLFINLAVVMGLQFSNTATSPGRSRWASLWAALITKE